MEKRAKFHGSLTALVTPFKDGKIDEPAYRALIDWQITSGSHGLVPVGTTGESPTLSHEEHRRAVDICTDEARGRVPVIAGAGSNNTSEAVELARHAEQVAPTPFWSSRPITTSRRRKAFTSTSRPSTTRSEFQFSSTTFPAKRRRHVGRHDEAAVRTHQHRRRQGRDRRCRARVAPTTSDGRGLYPTFWRRHDRAGGDGRRRARLHFGFGERSPGSAPS